MSTERIRGIYVPLSLSEFEALRRCAQEDTRPPRDQARFLLRQALGLTDRTATRDNAGVSAKNTTSTVNR